MRKKVSIKKKSTKKPQPLTLKDLLAGVTKENVHKETDWGRPVGKEVW